jgi:Peptidase S24-like
MKLRRHTRSSTGTDEGGAGTGSLSAVELAAIASLWRRERRKFVTSFVGTSMLPAIAPGQQVFVDCGAEPAVGEVVLISFDNQIGVHRIVARVASWLLTWGDANALPDEPIELAQVIGVVRNVPTAPRSSQRALLLRFIAPPAASVERVRYRVHLVHRIRSTWRQGPLVFIGTAVRAVARRLSNRGGS